MSPSRALTGRELIGGLGRLGFQVIRVKRSHHYLTVVPVHASETIGRGLLAKILRDAELAREALEAAL
jgi:predicted RNA binding protein YcfA (HicA-like mRNA interferase family)